MEDIVQLIRSHTGLELNLPFFIVVVSVMKFLGTKIKRAPKIPDELIPVLLMFLGMVFYVCLAGRKAQDFAVGAMAGLVSVGGHQLILQTKAALFGWGPQSPTPTVTTPEGSQSAEEKKET